MRRTTGTLVAAALIAATPAGAAGVEVTVTDNAFTPRSHTLRVGDSVHWGSAGTGNPHNVREDHQLFRSGAPTTGAIDLTRIVSAGAFHFFCEVHGSPAGGMDGVIRVKPRVAAPPAGPPFTVRWATASTTSGTAFDVQFRVGGGGWRPWRTNATAFRGVFGKGGSPIRLRDGVAYSFRARSQASRTADESASGWSPAATRRV